MSHVSNYYKSVIETVPESDMERFVCRVFEMLNGTRASFLGDVPVQKCKKCGSVDIAKHGKDDLGKHRYRCKRCGVTFMNTTHSLISNSNCGEDVWKECIRATFAATSLKDITNRCGVCISTAFNLRHKILQVVSLIRQEVFPECDEIISKIYNPSSFKGKHSDEGFDMHRGARDRCEMLYQKYKTSLQRFVSDNEQITDEDLLSITTGLKPSEAQLILRVLDYLGTYQGISSKYLNDYINLFLLFENNIFSKMS